MMVDCEITYKTKIIAKAKFKDCTHYTKNGLMVSGVLISSCERCGCDMAVFSTPDMLFRNENGGEVDVKKLCEDYLGLKHIDLDLYPESGNVEDYSDEFEVVCSDCCEEIMENYYGS